MVEIEDLTSDNIKLYIKLMSEREKVNHLEAKVMTLHNEIVELRAQLAVLKELSLTS
jgi:hypothetical protein